MVFALVFLHYLCDLYSYQPKLAHSNVIPQIFGAAPGAIANVNVQHSNSGSSYHHAVGLPWTT